MYNNTNSGDSKSPFAKNKVASIITQFDSSVTPVKDNGSNGLSLLFEVIKEFNARLGDELDLKVGQKIQVISDDSEYNDGWYMGKNLDTGNVGLYPKSFTQMIPNNSSNNGLSSPYPKPSLLRSRSRRLNSPSSQQNSPVTPSAQQASSFAPPSAGLSIHNDSSALSSSNDSLVPQRTATTTTTTAMNNGSSTRQSSVHNSTIKDIDNALAELTSVGGDLDPAQVETWTPEQVSSYFSSIGVDMESAGQFARHKITGAILLELELSHLKELDISSFGTRFEIFKVIEALKIESRNKSSSGTPTTGMTSTPVHSSLMPPPSVNRSDTAPLMGHQRKRSQSLDDIKMGEDHSFGTPTQTRSRQTSSNQRQSYVFKLPVGESVSPVPPPPPPPLNQLSNTTSSSSSSSGSLKQLNDQLFLSPRKAPAPPMDAQKLNTSYKFGGAATPDNGVSQQFSRLSTLPEKERQQSTTSRPTSSIYHSRSSSIPLASLSPTRGHKHSNSNANRDKHKRHSSVFSFVSGGGSINVGNDPYKGANGNNGNNSNTLNNSRRNSLVNLLSSPSKISLLKKKNINESGDEEDDDLTDLSPVNDLDTTPVKASQKSPLKDKISSPYRRSVSAQVASPQQEATTTQQKRATSEASRMKSLRNASNTHLQNLTGRSKTKTSLFKEGIQLVSPDDAIKTADHYGWMYKKGSLNFKKRYFTLHGTRLSYFQSLKDTHERGLIDIQAHKVLPTDSNDLKSMLLSSTTTGRYAFKLLPPAPGSRKGLTFTQPKVHFFAVSTKEEMRSWMAALMKATIDLDETVPVVSSYTSATISLKQAQVLQQKTSERAMLLSKNGVPGAGDDTISSSDTNNTSYETPKLQQQSRLSSRFSTKNDSEFDENSNTLTTGDDNESGGFDSPYLLASGLLSPKSPKSNHSEDHHNNHNNSNNSNTNSNSGSINRPGVQRTRTFGTNPVPMITNLENGTTSNSSPAAIAAANGAFKKK